MSKKKNQQTVLLAGGVAALAAGFWWWSRRDKDGAAPADEYSPAPVAPSRGPQDTVPEEAPPPPPEASTRNAPALPVGLTEAQYFAGNILPQLNAWHFGKFPAAVTRASTSVGGPPTNDQVAEAMGVRIGSGMRTFVLNDVWSSTRPKPPSIPAKASQGSGWAVWERLRKKTLDYIGNEMKIPFHTRRS